MSFRDAGESTDFLNLIYMLVCGTFVSMMTLSPQSGLDSRVYKRGLIFFLFLLLFINLEKIKNKILIINYSLIFERYAFFLARSSTFE